MLNVNMFLTNRVRPIGDVLMQHVAASVTVMMFIPVCNIDHESNDCESVGVTSVEGADALFERPIESNTDLDI